MVSLGPNSSSKDYKFMWDFPKHTYSTPKILSYLHRSEFSLFYLIVVKSNIVFDSCTLFIVSNVNMLKNGLTEELISQFDINQARQIILYNMIGCKVSKFNLQHIPSIYYLSKSKQQLLFTNTLTTTTINNHYEILIFDIECDTSILHMLSNVMIPIFL